MESLSQNKQVLSTEDIELLEYQGLHADIRNKLNSFSNLLTLLDAIETNPDKINELKELLKEERITAKKYINHIMLALDYDQNKKK